MLCREGAESDGERHGVRGQAGKDHPPPPPPHSATYLLLESGPRPLLFELESPPPRCLLLLATLACLRGTGAIEGLLLEVRDRLFPLSLECRLLILDK